MKENVCRNALLTLKHYKMLFMLDSKDAVLHRKINQGEILIHCS